MRQGRRKGTAAGLDGRLPCPLLFFLRSPRIKPHRPGGAVRLPMRVKLKMKFHAAALRHIPDVFQPQRDAVVHDPKGLRLGGGQ